MSPLGRLLIETCDENVCIDMTIHWNKFYLAGFNKNHVDAHAAAIGIHVIHNPFQAKKNNNTVIGMMPMNRRTIMGIPAPKVN